MGLNLNTASHDSITQHHNTTTPLTTISGRVSKLTIPNATDLAIMPTLYAATTTVQLSVANLKLATSPNPRTSQRPEVTADVERTLLEFAKGSRNGTLDETPLYAENGSHLRFLGKHQDMPFFMVRAGKNFFDATSKERRNRRAARIPLHEAPNGSLINLSNRENAPFQPVSRDTDPEYTPPQIPQALCLTVFLSPSSFIRTKQDNVSVTNDVKIDVYFNGHFCESELIPKRFNKPTYDMSEHIVRFTGQRIGRLIEKPWIIIPPGQNPNGSPRYCYGLGKGAFAGARPRWRTLADALMVEADMAGRKPSGERSVLGEYLESLASLTMPFEVESMQKAGNAKFGVLDVVITWGQGSKDDAGHSYLSAPTPIRLHEVKPVQALDSTNQTPEPIIQTPELMIQSSIQDVQFVIAHPDPPPKTRSEALAIAKALDESVKTIPAPPKEESIILTHISQSRSQSSFIFPSTITNGNIPNPAIVNYQLTANKKRPLSRCTKSASAGRPPKRPYRPAMPYHHIFTNKQTLAEEIESIAAQAAEDQKAGYQPILKNIPRATRASLGILEGETRSSSPLNAEPVLLRDVTPKPSKIITLKIASPAKSDASPPKPASSPLKAVADNPTNSNAGSRVRSRATSLNSELLTPGPASARKWQKTEPRPGTEVLDANFKVPELSEDCVVTFAEKGVLRNVAAVRSGRFEEGGLLMGVRFLVG
ncbi:hypothetical protein N7G274_005262 [Stereocaulon virgatum]|uniref:Uncharacterized protein n=1 Tax=Stereocaulon virgatum TaxID=373712 RepID=A0ABR4A853_9LECA